MSTNDHSPTRPARRSRGPGARALRWLLLAGSLGFIVYFFSRNQEDLALLRQIRLDRAALLVLLYVASYLAQGHRYQVVLEKCSERRLPFRPWFTLFILGRFLNTILPQAGNLYRSVRLKLDHGVGYTTYLSGLFSFAWLDTVFNMLVATLAIAWLAPGFRVGDLPLSPILLAIALAAAIGPVLLEWLLGRFRMPGRRLAWVHEKLAEVLEVAVVSLRDPVYLARVFVLGLLVFVISCVTFRVGFESLGIRTGVAQVVAFYVLLKLSNHVSLTPGNLGVLELGFGVVGEQIGVGMGESILVSGLLRITGFFALLVFAVPMGGLRLLAPSRHPGLDAESDGE